MPEPEPPQAPVPPTLPTPNGRGYFEVYDTPQSQRLTPKARALLGAAVAHTANTFRLFVEPLTRGGRYKLDATGNFVKRDGKLVFEPFPDGVLDIYELRPVQYWGSNLALQAYFLGDPDAYEWLASVAPFVAQNSATHYTWPVSERAKLLEQRGCRRYIDWSNGGLEGDLTRALDASLSGGFIQTQNFTFSQNPKRHPALAQSYSDFFLEDILRRRLYLGIMTYGGEKRKTLWTDARCDSKTLREILDIYNSAELSFPIEMWGQGLAHAVAADLVTFWLAWLQYGWPEFYAAAERLGKSYQEAHRFVQTEWGELCIVSHRIKGRFEQLGWTWKEGTEDATYLREKYPHDLTLYLTGCPWVTRRMLKGQGRMAHATLLYQGPQGSYSAGSVGGYSAKPGMNLKKVIVTRGGKEYPSPYGLAGPAGNIGIKAQARGMTYLFDYLADDPDLIAETRTLNGRYPPVNQGNSLPLLLTETGRI